MCLGINAVLAQTSAPTPQPIQICKGVLSTALACGDVVCAVPKAATDLVHVLNQGYPKYNTVSNVSPVFDCTKSVWSTLAALHIPLYSATLPPSGPPTVPSGTLTLQWNAPTQNTDGTPLTNISAYNIYQGPSATTLVKVSSVTGQSLSYTTPPVAVGTYYFAVTAIDSSGTESDPSATVSGTLNTVTPGKPTNVTVTVNIGATRT